MVGDIWGLCPSPKLSELLVSLALFLQDQILKATTSRETVKMGLDTRYMEPHRVQHLVASA